MGWGGCGGGLGTDLEGLGSGMGLEGPRWVRRAWDWGGRPRVGVKRKGIVWGPRMGMEGLICVWRVLVGCGKPAMGVRGFRCVWKAWDGY